MTKITCMECGEEVAIIALDERDRLAVEAIEDYIELTGRSTLVCDDCVDNHPFKYPDWSAN